MNNEDEDQEPLEQERDRGVFFPLGRIDTVSPDRSSMKKSVGGMIA